MDIADVLSPAIDLAGNGHPVLERVCLQIEAVAGLFTEHWPSSAALWMPEGRAPQPGGLIRNPERAAVLRGMLTAADGAHRILEALKLALADRDTCYGDPETEVDLAALLDPAYAGARRALIGEQAEQGFRPGSTDLPPPLVTDAEWAALRGDAADGAAGEPTVPGARGSVPAGTSDGPAEGGAATADGEVRGDTCHIDVVDRFGNMISATPSGGWLQSSSTIPGLGFCLGTRLQMTWLDESSPSALAPGRRPRTTLSPTLVLRDGEPVMACGTPGGDQQDQWQLPFLLRVLVGGYTPQQAIDAPMLHTAAAPGSFWPRSWGRAASSPRRGSVRRCSPGSSRAGTG